MQKLSQKWLIFRLNDDLLNFLLVFVPFERQLILMNDLIHFCLDLAFVWLWTNRVKYRLVNFIESVVWLCCFSFYISVKGRRILWIKIIQILNQLEHFCERMKLILQNFCLLIRRIDSLMLTFGKRDLDKLKNCIDLFEQLNHDLVVSVLLLF